MKIYRIRVENIYGMKDLVFKPSPNLSVIVGDPSTCKTSLMKASYIAAMLQTDSGEKNFPENLLDGMVYDTIDPKHLIRRDKKENINVGRIEMDDNEDSTFDVTIKDEYGFSKIITDGEKKPLDPFGGQIIYINPHEMISHSGSFRFLYEEYHIPYSYSDYGLIYHALGPYRRKLSHNMNRVASIIEDAIGGRILSEQNVFYLYPRDHSEKIETSLLSESDRKFALLYVLIQTGVLSKGAILFIDEPMAAIHPRLTTAMVDILMLLAQEGVQVIMTCNDYVMLSALTIFASYDGKMAYGDSHDIDMENLDIRYYAMYKEKGDIQIEQERKLLDLIHYQMLVSPSDMSQFRNN